MLNLTEKLKEFGKYELGLNQIYNLYDIYNRIREDFRNGQTLQALSSIGEGALDLVTLALFEAMNIADVGSLGYFIPAGLARGDYKLAGSAAVLVGILELAKYLASRPVEYFRGHTDKQEVLS